MNKTIISEGLLEECLKHYHGMKDEKFVVTPSLPIIFFGDIQSYNTQKLKVVTVGKNPSNREFRLYDERYSYVRFPKFKNDIHSLESTLNDYFKKHPYKRWFNSFEPLLNGMNCSYYPNNKLNKVIHTDICSPLSTEPTWSLLTSIQQDFLFKKGFKIWKNLILELKPELIIFSIPKKFVHLLDTKKLDTLYTIENTKNGQPRKKPYELELYSIRINDFETFLIYGESKNTPFGSVSTSDKISMGRKCLSILK